MSQHDNDRLKGTIKGDKGRQERLAAELRENLKRRKEQARAGRSGRRGDPGKDSADDSGS